MPNEQLKKAWDLVPWNIFPLSFKVDFCQFLAEIKPAVRTHILKEQNMNQFLISMLDLGFHSILDNKNFLFISRDKFLSKKIMKVDNSLLPHTAEFGRLLGYPECCVQYIEGFGENEIDRIAENYKASDFNERFSLIDITRYLEGIALISHVPCSTKCQPSLNIATSTYSFIKENNCQKGFNNWAESIKEYFNH
ncbi:MAG: DUF483 domain-containing protein [Alphaproteobacteria bacterium]|nr:DUF483 domain-containing protein [Alphaproteobacteria bacterium]